MMASRNAARFKSKAGTTRRQRSSAAVGEAVLSPAVESALFAPRDREQFACEPKSATFTPLEFEFGDRSATLPARENERRETKTVCKVRHANHHRHDVLLTPDETRTG